MAVLSPRRLDRPEWGISDPSLVRRRAWGAVGLLTFIFAGLGVRLWYLQVVEGQEFFALAQANRVRRVPLAAPRGLILDRKGRVLATSRTTHSVCVVPAALPSARRDPRGRERVLKTLGFLINQSPAQIEKALQEAKIGGAHIYDPIRILEDAPYQVLTRIEENKPRLGPAVLVTDDLRRFYPNGSLAAHVLGYTGRVSARELDRNKKLLDEGTSVRELGFDDMIGKIGVERSYDDVLSGERGAKQYLVDSRLRPMSSLPSLPETPGRTLQLTLDADLQRAAEKALGRARNSGAVAVVDVNTGAVVALASNPTFDPNIFSRRGPQGKADYQELVANPKKPMLFRAVSSRWPPGSTFKMVTAAAGLQNATISPASSWGCGGGLRMGRFFGCWDTHGAGIKLERALSHSCDVYFYQAALRMGNPETTGPTYLASVARRFGLGQKTGIDLPIDGAGLIPDPAWRREFNRAKPDLQRWFPGNTLNMSIGQGDVLATPLQMALATAAVANGGWKLKPHLLQAVRDENGRALDGAQTQRQSVGIDAENLRLIRAGMRAVVTKGTGKAIAMPHVAVAGKTGSAEDANHALPHAWFVCFAPYDKPKYAIAAIIENSGHGSDNAVPVCKAILEAAFPPSKKARLAN